jgi:Holliday junction resolvase RusA-like endonuclease
MFLHPDIRKFRQTVDMSLRDRINFFPTGLIAAIIEFQSPDWITKARTVRKMDIDNKIKPVLDAIEHCTGIKDELYWHVHAIKVVSKERKTVVHLFDIGDVVELIA